MHAFFFFSISNKRIFENWPPPSVSCGLLKDTGGKSKQHLHSGLLQPWEQQQPSLQAASLVSDVPCRARMLSASGVCSTCIAKQMSCVRKVAPLSCFLLYVAFKVFQSACNYEVSFLLKRTPLCRALQLCY